jgi:arsenical-resistance protein 2
VADASNPMLPWYAAYPALRNQGPARMPRSELLEMIRIGKNIAGKDFILIDLRRNDYEVRYL